MNLDLSIYITILICATAMAILPLVKDVIKREEAERDNKRTKKRKPSTQKVEGKQKKNIFQKLTWSGRMLLFCAAITIGFSIWGKIRDDRQKDLIQTTALNETRDLKDEIKSLRFTIDTLSNDPSDKVTNGFSLFSILQVEDVLDRKKKFIFDCGESAYLNRLSLFLDYDNNLVFSIIDNSGVTYSVRAVPNFVTFKDKATYFLHCSIGYSNNFSFIRIFLDDRLVGIQTFNNKISGEKFDWVNPRIGSDLKGDFNGKFFLESIVFYKKVFNRKQIIDIMNHLIPQQ